MHHRKGNFEQYKIRKKVFDEPQEVQDEDPPYERNYTNTSHRSRNEPTKNFKKPQKKQWFEGLSNFTAKGAYRQTNLKNPFINKKFNQQEKRQMNPPKNQAQIDKPEYADLKQRLDKEIQNYSKNRPIESADHQENTKGDKPEVFKNRIVNQSEDLSISMKKQSNRGEQYSKKRSKPVQKKEDYKQPSSGDTSSFWVDDEQNQSNVSTTNILKSLNDDNLTVKLNPKEKAHKKIEESSINHKFQKIEARTAAKQKDQSSIHSLSQCAAQIYDSSLGDHQKKQTFPPDLLNEDFENEANFKEKIIEQQPLMPLQQLKNNIQSFQQGKWLKVSLQFQAYDNILELKIKQVQLTKLSVVVHISNNGKTSLLNYPDFSQEQIEKCISFITTSYYFPKIFGNQLQDFPNSVEGDQSYDMAKPCSKADLDICKVKGVEAELEKGDIDKSVIIVRSVEVSCMECQTVNKVMIVQSNNTIISSCRACSTKMEGKITALKLRSE